MYLAWRGGGAFLKEGVAADSDAEYSYGRSSKYAAPACRSARHEHPRVAVSRSHKSPELAEYIEELRKSHPDLEVVEQGSSYKFCLLAEGAVDYYFRTTSTYEWDTAAGELILSEVGAKRFRCRIIVRCVTTRRIWLILGFSVAPVKCRVAGRRRR